MDAILIIKDTLNINVSGDPLYSGKMIYVDDTLTVCGKYIDEANVCNDGVWIVGIICLTVLILSILGIGLFLYMKRKAISDKAQEITNKGIAEVNILKQKLENETVKEKALCRERLFNYLEKGGNNLDYINELKNFIKDTKPTEIEENAG